MAKDEGTGSRRSRLGNMLWPAGAFLIAMVLQWAGVFQPLDRTLGDLRFSLLQRPVPEDIVLVAIDPRSLSELEIWPWPRRHYAEVIDTLLEAGAQTVALDVDFSARSNPEDDAIFASTLARAGQRVVLPRFRQWQVAGRDSTREPGGEASGGRWVVNQPLAAFANSVRLASVNVWQEADGMVRRGATLDRWQGVPRPSMAALLAGLERPAQDSFAVDFSFDPNSIPRISFVDVLSGTFDPAQVRGRKFIIGATAAELRDDIPVPLHASLNGVSFHILSYHSIMSGRMLQEIGFLPVAVLGLLIVLALAGLFRRWSWRAGLALAVGGCLLLFAFSLVLQAALPLLLPTAGLCALVILLLAGGVARRLDLQSLELFLQGLRLNQANMTMRKVVESSFDGIFTVDAEGRVLTANPAAEEIFGLSEESLLGRDLRALVPGLPKAEAGLKELVGEREAEGRRADGRPVPLDVALSELNLGDEERFVLVLSDATERKRQLTLLEHQATHDSLTGLANRSLLLSRLEQAVPVARVSKLPVALLLMDLDRFKAVNDTLGHQIGDQLLCAVAERLRAALRPCDCLARLGGDEFAVVLPVLASREEALEIAAALRRALEESFPVADLSLDIGASIGVALFPEHAEEPRVLLQCADVAMYLAKQGGEGVCLYDPERDRNSVRHLTLNGELRHAIDQDGLTFHYQPKLNLATGEVIGAEALIRWFHPTLGFVPPDEFILLAEQTGLIERLTQWVFNHVFGQMARWHAEGMKVGVAINLSAHNLQNEDLPEQIAGHLERTGLPPESVTLEITETAIMVDPEGAAEVVRRLHALGVRISVDDFGTGHSSLAYLKRLPLHELKIDRTFVMHMSEDDDDAVIVRSTVDLAHNLGLQVVAEGVETETHLQILRGLGCDKAQGYFISRPLAADAFADWCRQWRPSDEIFLKLPKSGKEAARASA